MQKLKSFVFEAPPYGTGFWCSMARAGFGGILLLKLGEVPAVPILMSDMACLPGLMFTFALALCLVAGLLSRPAALLASALCLACFYIKVFNFPNYLRLPLVGPGSFGEPINTYFIGIMLLFLGLTPCGDYFSLDSMLKKHRPQAVSLWGVQLIRYQICAMYLWTALAKISPKFLSGHALEMAWIKSVVGSLGYFHQPAGTAVFQLLGFGVIAFEMTLAILLFIPRLRKAGILAGLAFHSGAMLVLPVQYFTLSVVVCYLLFLDPPQDHGGVGTTETKTSL